MPTSPKPTPTEEYVAAAKAAGCPPDQIANFLRARIVLQPKQLQFTAAARSCDRPCTHRPDEPCTVECGPTMLGFGGARGGGKSHVTIAQVAADDCQRFPGLKCLILRKVGKSGKENFDDLRRRMLQGVPHEYSESKGILEMPNGSRILTGHFQNEKDIDAYLGIEYDVIVAEEATTLSRGKFEDIGTCNRSSKPGFRPRMYLTFNPGGVGHGWVKKQLVEPSRKGVETDTRFIAATARDNAFNNPEYLAKLMKLTGWKRRAWLEGDFDIASGQYFKNFRRDIHVVPLPELPRHWRVWLGFDYGFTHYTACYLIAEDGDGNVFIVDEHAEQGWLPARHAEAIFAMLARHGVFEGRLETIVAGHDCWSKDRNGATTADAYEALGLTFERANVDRIAGAGEILRRLGDLDNTPPIQPTLFIAERCERLIECLPSLEHDPAYAEKVKKVDTDEDGQGGDDFYDATRYGVTHAGNARNGQVANKFDDLR
jgi:phage terminase large subunit